jgi:hypothetical protein
MEVWIWLFAAALYACFLAWYQNWRPALSAREVDDLISRISRSGLNKQNETEDLGRLETFLRADDGREFYMLNLVRIAPHNIADPVTGQQRPARQVLESYTKSFLAALFRRGGHPALVARKVGGYLDAWGVEADPGWTIIGYMRYRSRRDLAQLVAAPEFAGSHVFKHAAMPNTLSFPTHIQITSFFGPTSWVAIMLALIAALAHIFLVIHRGG